MIRLNEYRVMWLFVFFDLPTETKKERHAYAKFRKRLLDDGFNQFQYSVYVRHCASVENAEVHQKRVRGILPDYGSVCMMCLTDRQFEAIEVFHAYKSKMVAPPQAIQLELF
ncbi:MAG: CRISPR-associated endonuclease Cas2 [Bacteroidaceae bacterium]|nr:CRISPR-associated endonuclease Cas2 [Bacteroidaceae bacterium]